MFSLGDRQARETIKETPELARLRVAADACRQLFDSNHHLAESVALSVHNQAMLLILNGHPDPVSIAQIVQRIWPSETGIPKGSMQEFYRAS